MYLTGLTHREALFDLTVRWLNDDFHEGDGRIITEIFLYEGFISGSFVIHRMSQLLRKIFGADLEMGRIRQKQLLRERLIQYSAHPTGRTEELVRTFRENPEFFFPRLPIDAVLVVAAGKRLVSIGRIKRLSRVAEKVSFRLMDALFQEIKAEAQRIAEKRAALAGLPLNSFISPPEAMQQDFVDAEMAVAARFRYKGMQFERNAFAVDDMLGFKIIGEPEDLDMALNRLKEEPGFRIVEIQHHSGNYNAVNLSVDIQLPDPGELMKSLQGLDWSIAALRGLNPDEARRRFPHYLERGSRSVRTEIILSTYPELMESEFGRSVHELRILRLREQTRYSGLIAQNAGYLIEFLLTLAMAPVVEVPELPVRLYGRYLPETIRAAKCALFGNDIDGSLLNAFCVLPECTDSFCLPAS
ncbi:MAG: hypothetical protein U5R49_04575 [Deltaproteobacteria bacterium]|nr:hypothetical protein [Deltaproteobacteria bacterium]